MIAADVLPDAAPHDAARRWRIHGGVLAACVLAILLLFRRDAADIAAIWWNSSTFNHCLIVVPIIAWLVQQRWPALRGVAPAAWWPGLALVACGAFAWLLGEAASVALGRHLGLVVMVQGAVVALLGRTVAGALLFPIAYALFLVPFGEEFVPALQTLTATLAMALLGWVGIPAHIEGVFITTPHGWFEVAEACSGVKFVIAMVALSALAAHLLFDRWGRRAAFMALAVAIPVVANGFRAFATIWYAERYGVEHAAGFDHVVYGWVFFAVVIAVMMALGWRFADRPAGADMPDRVMVSDAARTAPGIIAAIALVLVAAPAALLWLNAPRGVEPFAIAVPRIAGWQAIQPVGEPPWRPTFAGADRVRRFAYRDADRRMVDVVVASYRRQSEGRELVGYGQGEDAGNGWAWSGDTAPLAGVPVARIVAPGAAREVASVYRVGARTLVSRRDVKLAMLTARLAGGDQRGAAILVAARDGRAADARAALDAFFAAAGSPSRFAEAVVRGD